MILRTLPLLNYCVVMECWDQGGLGLWEVFMGGVVYL